MNGEAIKEIQRLAVEAAKAREFSIDGIPVLVDGSTVIDLEKFGHTRRRFRGTFKTESIQSFVAYLAHQKRNGFGDDVVVYIAERGIGATAILNQLTQEGDPGQCDHRAILEPAHTALWQAITRINGVAMSQRQLSDWIDDWGPWLEAAADDEHIPIAVAQHRIRSIKITEAIAKSSVVEDFGARKSGLAEVAAKHAQDERMPKIITAMVQPITSMEPRPVSMRLGISGTDDPKLTLRVIGLDHLLESVTATFGELVRLEIAKKIEGDTPILAGAFNP